MVVQGRFKQFQPTHPSRGATLKVHNRRRPVDISTHAPLTGCDREQHLARLSRVEFQPTHPSRGATVVGIGPLRQAADFNPRTPHGVRPAAGVGDQGLLGISTHAPLTGCDRFRSASFSLVQISTHAPLTGCDLRWQKQLKKAQISTHAPLTGCDLVPLPDLPTEYTFQPTHPSRGATAGIILAKFSRINFNPRTPHGVRQHLIEQRSVFRAFQPTHPSRGATIYFAIRKGMADISTHAPLTGCDCSNAMMRSSKRYFNPRTPHGVRPSVMSAAAPTGIFQPTHPSRGATRLNLKNAYRKLISTHAPLTGCDAKQFLGQGSLPIFQPTHPSRGATMVSPS